MPTIATALFLTILGPIILASLCLGLLGVHLALQRITSRGQRRRSSVTGMARAVLGREAFDREKDTEGSAGVCRERDWA
ncbi:hypothetical protein QBC39DRAFT_373092 [Podospora conica]|nr:hypothetical protein QBC39DRAFT_373092 [Schizothecium conicum]